MRIFPVAIETMIVRKIHCRELGKEDRMAQEEMVMATRGGRRSRGSIVKKLGGQLREPLHGDSQEVTAFPEWATGQRAAEVEA